jgi:hypothetical protein
MMIKRSLKLAGVFGLLAVCLALDNPPPPGDKCLEYCQSVVPAGVEAMEECLKQCRENGGPPSCSFAGF